MGFCSYLLYQRGEWSLPAVGGVRGIEDLLAVAEDVSLARPFLFALVQHLKLSLDDPTNRVRFVRSEDFRRLARVVHFHR